MIGNSGEKTPVSQKIHLQVGDTPKKTASHYRSIAYLIVCVELPDTTEVQIIPNPIRNRKIGSVNEKRALRIC